MKIIRNQYENVHDHALNEKENIISFHNNNKSYIELYEREREIL